MPTLHVVKDRDPESLHSPELEYLVSLDLLQARAVYDEVSVTFLDEDGTPPEPGEGDHVLLLHRDPVLLGRRSLAALRDAIEGGASTAVPFALSECRPPGWDRVFTLRELEEVEEAFLEDPGPASPEPGSLRPVALLDRDAFSRLRDRLGPGLDLSAGFDRPEGTAFAGLQHTFIDYYGEIRRDVLPYVPPGARSVLEIGCGRGVTGAWLRERLGCRVTGVEVNPAVAADAATRLDRVIAADVAEVDLDERFDAVLALELFEHLPRPEPVLRTLGGLLAPGGRIVLSVPNVGHYSVVRDLLAGRWDYLPVGLLCYTHYRFFTRRTLEGWIRRCGFDRFELVPQRTPVPGEMVSIPGLDVDRESLGTKGFWVLIEG